MIFASIDIETTGLDPEKCSVLSIGAIIEDTTKKLPYEELPKFNAIILQREISGSPRALTMNKDIIKMMGEYLEGTTEKKEELEKTSGYLFLEQEQVVPAFFDFLFINGFRYDVPVSVQARMINGKILPVIGSKTKPILLNVAGKNFGTFDKVFLEKLPRWQQLIRIKQRVIDPAILFCDWKNDDALPSLSECKKRINIDSIVAHTALEDAWDVIQLLRKFY